MKKIFLFLLLVSVIYAHSQNYRTTQDQSSVNPKINGMTLVATHNPIDHTAIIPIKNYNANYGAIIPYAWMQSLEEPKVYYNDERGSWGGKSNGVKITTQLMKDKGMNVLLKPQIWISRGAYTGHIKLNSEESWVILEDSYTDYIMRFALIAEKEKIDMFCIGTELDSFVNARPEYWKSLIKKIREVYNGKLTYAGNWDSYKRVSFWNELDYIGIDAYFPISDEKTPNLATIKKSWKKWKNEMKKVSEKFNRKILFTEYGYISADYAGKEPWANAGEDRAVNEEAQHILFQGLYESVWKEDWMAGGFIWKYHAEKSSRRSYEKRFTPQGKKAEQTVTDAYGKN